MAEKRYYWLKLKENYLDNPKIKKLRKIAGGDTYTIIYLKMQLESVKTEGILKYEGIEPTFEEELALKLDEELDNVKVTLAYLISQDLIENNENDYLLPEATTNIGSESSSAERVRQFRERQNALQCNSDVTLYISNSISSSKSKSLSKHKYGEYKHILLSDEEMNKLNNEYGEEETKEAIKYLDEYIEMKGAKYKSHYLVLRKWVYDAIKQKTLKNPDTNYMHHTYTKEQLDNLFDDINNIEV